MVDTSDPARVYPGLSRVIAIVNGKGGVLKTSTAANLAGHLAAARYRVLAVDLDPSGDLGLEFGYAHRNEGDDGRAVVTALAADMRLEVLKEVRPNLDVLPGGPNLAGLEALEDVDFVQAGGGLGRIFAARLAELVESNGYDLVVIDSPPGHKEQKLLQGLALAAARYVIIPTRTDQASWNGLRAVVSKVNQAREAGNPDLTYLGILVTANQTSATTVLRRTRVFLDDANEALARTAGYKIPLFDSRIRASETAAHDCRARGELVYELAEAATAEQADRFKRLRARVKERDTSSADGGHVQAAPVVDRLLSGTSPSLADDYLRFTREVLLAINAHEEAVRDPKTQASDADRDDTVRQLHERAATSQLTSGELDQRVALANAAATRDELAELTTDLPDVPATPLAEAR